MKAEVLVNGETVIIDLAETTIEEMSKMAMTNSVEVISLRKIRRDNTEQITWDQIETIAKPGDELYGDFFQTSWERDEKGEYVPIEHPTNKLVFWSCITCLTDKPDVRKGARFFKAKDSKTLYRIKKETDHDDKSNISQH